MTTQKKFKDMTSADQLRDRVYTNFYGHRCLSVGIYWHRLQHLMTKERVNESQELVRVNYCSNFGTDTLYRYI